VIYKLYHGSSPYLSLEALKQDIKQYSDIKFQIINAESKNPQEIYDQVGSNSLFESRRGIVIKRLYKNKEKDKLIDSLLAVIEKSITEYVIYFWEDEKLRVNTRYLKFFVKTSSANQYDELNKRTFATWLKDELKRNGLEMDSTLQKLLAERTNYNPERCANEIKKLKLDPQADTRYIADTLENDIWNLIDSINQKNRAQSLNILENLYKQNSDPNYILSMLARNLRIMTLVKYLNEQGRSFKEICSILRIPPFTLPSILDSSKGYEWKNITQIYKKLANLDHQIKTGKIDGNLGLTLICPYL